MKKLIIIFMVLILCACQSNKDQNALQEAKVSYFIDSETVLLVNIDKQSEIQKLIQYFNDGNIGYQQVKDGELDFKISFIKQNGEKTFLEAYTVSMMDKSSNFARLICIDSELFCREFYANEDFYETMKKIKGSKEEILYNKVKPSQNDAYVMLKAIGEDVEDTKTLGDQPEIISALIHSLPENNFYQRINEHQAKNMKSQLIYDNPPLADDFMYYPFDVVEYRGKQYFSPDFELTDIKNGEYFVTPYFKIYADIEKRGFLKVENEKTNHYGWELIATEFIDEGNQQFLTFIKAPTFKTFGSIIDDDRRQFIDQSGNLSPKRAIHESIYDETFDRAHEFDQVRITLKDEHIMAVNFLNKVDKKRVEAPLSVENFVIDYEYELPKVQVNSPNLDLRALENVKYESNDIIELKENNKYIEVIVKNSQIYRNAEQHYLFDKVSGNNLSVAEVDDRYDGKLLDTITEQMGDVEICPYYYEDAYLMNQCYEKLTITRESSSNPYDEIMDVPFYINQDGQLAIGIIMKENGTFKEMKEVILK